LSKGSRKDKSADAAAGASIKEQRPGTSLQAIFILAGGWVGFAVYIFIFFFAMDGAEGHSFIEHFLSPEHSGIRFRALVFFAPFITTVIGFLVNEREKFLTRTVVSESKYRDLFQNANDPIFIVDDALRFVDVNRRAVELLDHSKEEFLRMNLRDIMPAGEIPFMGRDCTGLRESDLREKYVTRMRAREGCWLDVEVSTSAIVRGGKVVGSRNIVRDITDLRHMQEELSRTYEALKVECQERTASLRETEKKLQTEISERKKTETRMAVLLKGRRPG
jgi:PAS domain S-box-containing protein